MKPFEEMNAEELRDAIVYCATLLRSKSSNMDEFHIRFLDPAEELRRIGERVEREERTPGAVISKLLARGSSN